MKLFSYGDSWTEGTGADIGKENSLKNFPEKLREFRIYKSYTYHLSNLLNCEFVNNGKDGCSNNSIFNHVISDVKSNKITSSDIVIVAWSSTLRDNVPFFPNSEWHIWGNDWLQKNNQYVFVNYNLTEDEKYNNFLIDYKTLFIAQMFNQNYYNIINQNYIIFLQELFKYYKINYIFCDAFDNMIYNINPKDNKLNLILKDRYWGFCKKTFKSLLEEQNDDRLWESGIRPETAHSPQHASEFGYKFIASELYQFIKNNNFYSVKESNYNSEKLI
jgi:hypothetical protein